MLVMITVISCDLAWSYRVVRLVIHSYNAIKVKVRDIYILGCHSSQIINLRSIVFIEKNVMKLVREDVLILRFYFFNFLVVPIWKLRSFIYYVINCAKVYLIANNVEGWDIRFKFIFEIDIFSILDEGLLNLLKGLKLLFLWFTRVVIFFLLN